MLALRRLFDKSSRTFTYWAYYICTNPSIADAPWFDAFVLCEVCIRPRSFAHCNWVFGNRCDSPCHYLRLCKRQSCKKRLRWAPCKILPPCKKKKYHSQNGFPFKPDPKIRQSMEKVAWLSNWIIPTLSYQSPWSKGLSLIVCGETHT